MAEAPQKTPPARDWRLWILPIVLAIVLARPTAQGVEKAFEASLGYWGAFAVSSVAAGVVTGLVASVVSWMMGRDWRLPLAMGLVTGLALSTGATVREKALEASLGYWGAFAVSSVAAGVVAGLVALVVSWMIKLDSGGRG